MADLTYLRPGDGCMEVVVAQADGDPIVRKLTDQKVMQWLAMLNTHLDMRLREIGFYEGTDKT